MTRISTYSVALSKAELASISFSVLCAVLASYFAAFRYFGEGFDNSQYILFYSDLRADDLLSNFRFEVGFTFLAQLFKFDFSLEYQYFYFIIILATLYLKLRVLSREKNPALVVSCYVLSWYPLHDYTQFRLAVALALLFLAFKYFLKRRFVFAAVPYLASGLFHYTALLVAPVAILAFLLRRQPILVGMSVMIGVAIVANLIIASNIAFINTVNPLSEAYLLGDDASRPNLFSVTNILMGLSLASVVLFRGLQDDRNRTTFLLVFAAFPLLVALSGSPVFAQRAKEILMVFSVFLIFNRKITLKAIPQMTFGILFSLATVYYSVVSGILGGNL